jgi:hypothetical protein
MTKHIATQGDCFHSLAERYGFADASKISGDPGNSDLARDRNVPGILRPGDVVTIPDRTPKKHECAAGASHSFERKGKPLVVKIKLLDRHGKPRAGLSYELAFDDIVKKGSTDGDGFVKEKIPPRAEMARLTLVDGDDREVIELGLGWIDPLADDAGVQQRLANLGYDDGTEHGTWTESKKSLLRAFQKDHDLEPKGELDDATRDKIREKHGC